MHQFCQAFLDIGWQISHIVRIIVLRICQIRQHRRMYHFMDKGPIQFIGERLAASIFVGIMNPRLAIFRTARFDKIGVGIQIDNHPDCIAIRTNVLFKRNIFIPYLTSIRIGYTFVDIIRCVIEADVNSMQSRRRIIKTDAVGIINQVNGVLHPIRVD